ncbi:alpha/beta hydrolase [Sulfuriferula multivorans]|uniref:alpha/beta hydrolase n=1 Tax=Sulfuriferula multivorans TaxID=1559896 RepID=UPI000F5BEA59|nr:alpha/beta hydrolase [Sulfuriferula multivorans]
MGVPVITVRKEKVGGPLLPEAQAADGFELRSSRLIVLIHGYNNTQEGALASYGKFLENSGLDKASSTGQPCGFLWPGDKDWGLLSAFSYPFELEPAKQSAALLHTFLLKQTVPGNWPLEVTLVCHSLGNRLGLELVDQYLKAGSPSKLNYSAGCFMAAAVPVFMVDDGGALNPAARAVHRSAVLHSEDDIVLHYAFPLGQTVAGEGMLPRAIGRYGQPSAGLWSQRTDMGIYGYNHGYYWDHPESANAVRKFLGLTVENEIPTAVITSHETQMKAPLRERDMPVRKIVGRELVLG